MGWVCLCGTLCRTVTKIFQLWAEMLWLWVAVCVFVSLCPSSWFVIYLVTPSIAHPPQHTSILLGLKPAQVDWRNFNSSEDIERNFLFLLEVSAACTLHGKCRDQSLRKHITGKGQRHNWRHFKSQDYTCENSLKTALKTGISEQKQTHACFHLQVCSVWNIAQVCNFRTTSVTKWNC